MKSTLRLIPVLALALLFTASRGLAQSGSPTGTTTVSVAIGPQAGLTIMNSSTPLTASGSNFNVFTGSTNLTYYIRTSMTGGGGNIGVIVSSDFSPSGGPSVASPLRLADRLTYTCTVASPGNACTTTQIVSTSYHTTLATFGTDAHTSYAGSTATANWSLANDPSYQTGNYSATVTFTISAS